MPNGLSSRCACDFQSPPACSCGGDLPSDPKADPGRIDKLGSVGAIAYSPDRALFAVSHGERVFLLDASTLRERFHLEGHTAFVRALVFGPDGKTLISGADDRTSRRWDLATGKELSRLTSDGAGITALAFAPDGTWVAAGSGHGTFFGWDLTSSKEVREASKDPTRRWDAVSGDEQKGARTPAMGVAHPGDGGWLDLIDRTSEARPKALWSTLNLVASTAYKPGGGAVAVGRRDMTVSLLDGAGERVLAVHRGPAGVVSAVAWTRDGRVLISGGDDGEIRFWSAGGRPLAVLRVVEGTPDSYVFTEGSDARIEVFGAAASCVPLCRVGRETSPFEACARRFNASGLLSAALRP